MAAKFHLLSIGKLRDKGAQIIEDEYAKRLIQFKLQFHESKARAEDKDSEGEMALALIKKIDPHAGMVLLCEQGQLFDSIKFSEFCEKLYNGDRKNIFFVIAGAEGPSAQLKEAAQHKLSLSPLTFPHQMARIILVEQIYRAQCISSGHPYHN